MNNVIIAFGLVALKKDVDEKRKNNKVVARLKQLINNNKCVRKKNLELLI